MKLLLCLFSLYILVLSGIPCRADDGCCQEEIAANAAHPQPNKEHPEYPAPCSPFFACGACHGFVIPEYYSDIPPSYALTTPHTNIYQPDPLPHFSTDIWQPPQLA